MNNRKQKIILIGAISVFVVIITTALIIRSVRKKNGIKLKNPNPKKILIVGDSQSAIISPSGQRINYTYPNLLQDRLEKNGVEIDVMASVGKTTAWMKKNLPLQLAKKKYDRVIIYGGGNDTSSSSISLETTLNNIQDMVDMSIENGADAFVNLGYKIQGDFGNYKIMPLTAYIKDRKKYYKAFETTLRDFIK
jgi:lysophospholipase L1-like esterase